MSVQHNSDSQVKKYITGNACPESSADELLSQSLEMSLVYWLPWDLREITSNWNSQAKSTSEAWSELKLAADGIEIGERTKRTL